MMNVLKSMFGVCSSSGEKVEVHEMIKRIFGNDMVMKDNTDRHNQRIKYLNHVRDNLPKVLDMRLSTTRGKSSKKQPIQPELSEMNDERRGRIGPRIVVFDATTATGRLVLVGDERVSVEALSNFATIRATACVYDGRWMYEVQLGTKGIMQIGWCTNSCTFSVDTGVGDTARSYSYDGARVRKWNVATSQYGQSWRAGDVIGSCLDLDKGTMEFFRNGVSLGIAFGDVSRGPGLAYFPAVSLASQEHLYANFGHVPFVFPVVGYEPLQAPPRRECGRASHLLGFLDALLDEFARLSDLRAPVSGKRSKAETSKVLEEEVALRVHSAHSVYNHPSPHDVSDPSDSKGMSKKAFLMSLARLVVVELATALRPSYVVIAELLPRFRSSLGLGTCKPAPEPRAAEFYAKMKARNFIGLASKLMFEPRPRFCMMMDLLWTFMDEVAFCDVLEHCVVREALLYDVVPQDMQFSKQIEGLYVMCGLLQHRNTRHRLVRHVLFNKICFDNFLNVKRPDDGVLKTVLRTIWWRKPVGVVDETDSLIAEVTENDGATHQVPSVKSSTFSQNDAAKEKESDIISKYDAMMEKRYKDDCEKITVAIVPLEQIQLEFVLMLLDNTDGTRTVPCTRKLFLDKFRRFIMDNCILDMRLFNLWRNSPSTNWCCHARLLTAVLVLQHENPSVSKVPMHIPSRCYVDGELDFYNVDRLGGVLPFLVRTLRNDLIKVLGEDNAFIQSFEPSYNRSGGVDTGVSEMTAGSPGLAALPQVISSMTRFMQQTIPSMPNGTTSEAARAVKGTRSTMPGAGGVDDRIVHLRLIDALLALYHGAALKHAEKLSELRDNQADMADCLYDIQQRINTITLELDEDAECDLNENDNSKKQIMAMILVELERSKVVYEEKLKSSTLHMAWVVGAMWTKKRQLELCKQFSGILHSLRLASDADYAAQEQVGSKEILPGKSLLLGGTSSYGSLELEYTSSSDQSAQNTSSGLPTPHTDSPFDLNSPNPKDPDFPESLFAFVPEYHVDAMLELCNTLRLYMHPTVSFHQIPDWDELMVSCAAFLCAEFADQRIVLASTRESLVQTLASFATQSSTMKALERVPLKQQMRMVAELLKPYQNRPWAQSNWVLVRFWHGSGFAFRYRQWPHLAEKYGDREPTVNNLGAKLDAGLMSQCFSPCPSEVIQNRIGEYLRSHPKEAAAFLNSLLSQINWAFSEFVTMMQEIDRIEVDANLESRHIRLCASCFDLYHGLARALEMTLRLAPGLIMKTAGENYHSDLLLGRICQILMAVVSRVCGGGGGFSRLAERGLPDTDRVHHCVALAPVAGCLLAMLDPALPSEHVSRVKQAIVSEPLFQVEGLDFMLGRCRNSSFSFYNYPEAVSAEELSALESAFDALREAALARSAGSSSTQSDLLCTICYTRVADTKFQPCGHYSCRACIMQHLLNSKQCFFCKADVDTIVDMEQCNV